MPSDRSAGLRERKKLATRTALSEAAMRLAAERGLEHVRVDDIAAEADVSPRTFNNYFASKEEAIVSLLFARVADLCDAVADRPPDEPVWESITIALTEQAAAIEESAEWRRWARLVAETPALEAEQLKAYAALERALAEEIAQRTGTSTEHDLYPSLAACAVVGAVRAALRHQLEHDDGGSYRALLAGAVRSVGAGLDPTRT